MMRTGVFGEADKPALSALYRNQYRSFLALLSYHFPALDRVAEEDPARWEEVVNEICGISADAHIQYRRGNL